MKGHDSIVIAGHKETDADSLWSIEFMSRLAHKVNPEAEIYSIVDTLQNVTWDTSEFIKKYSLGVTHINSLNMKTDPTLLLLTDTQLGTNYSLIPDDIDKKKITISCWDHHKLLDHKYIADFRSDAVNSTATIIINQFIKQSESGAVDYGYADFLKDSIELSTIGYQAVYIDTDFNQNVMVEADKVTHRFFQNNADLIYLHNLNKRKITPATATILAKAYEEDSRKNIGSLVTFAFIPWMKEGQGGELATVANDILRIDDSLDTSMAAGIVEETADKENFLKISIRASNPTRDIDAREVAALFSGGGDRYKAGAQLGLGILKYSTKTPEFRQMVTDEINGRIMGSSLNESGDRPTAKKLESPEPLESVMNATDIQGDFMAMINNASKNFSIRGNNKYITLFVNGDCDECNYKLGEKDIASFLEIEDLYLKKGEKWNKFKSSKSSVIYGIINDEVQPYVIALVSVKKNGEDSLNSENIAQQLFECIKPETLTTDTDNIQRTLVRASLPHLEYSSQHKNLYKIVNIEMEERMKRVLGDAKED